MQFEPLPEAVAKHCWKLVNPQLNVPEAMLPYCTHQGQRTTAGLGRAPIPDMTAAEAISKRRFMGRLPVFAPLVTNPAWLAVGCFPKG